MADRPATRTASASFGYEVHMHSSLSNLNLYLIIERNHNIGDTTSGIYSNPNNIKSMYVYVKNHHI